MRGRGDRREESFNAGVSHKIRRPRRRRRKMPKKEAAARLLPKQDNNDNFVVESNRQKMAKAPDGEDEHPFVVGRFPISDCDGKLEAFNLELSRRPDEWSACVKYFKQKVGKFREIGSKTRCLTKELMTAQVFCNNEFDYYSYCFGNKKLDRVIELYAVVIGAEWTESIQYHVDNFRWATKQKNRLQSFFNSLETGEPDDENNYHDWAWPSGIEEVEDDF